MILQVLAHAGRSAMTGIPFSIRCLAGPIPLNMRIFGELIAPAARIDLGPCGHQTAIGQAHADGPALRDLDPLDQPAQDGAVAAGHRAGADRHPPPTSAAPARWSSNAPKPSCRSPL
jgi:hypothetical protein